VPTIEHRQRRKRPHSNGPDDPFFSGFHHEHIKLLDSVAFLEEHPDHAEFSNNRQQNPLPHPRHDPLLTTCSGELENRIGARRRLCIVLKDGIIKHVGR